MNAITGDQERLIVMLEARISDFEKKMQRAERKGTSTYRGLSRDSRRATRQMEMDMNRSSASINRAISGVSSKIGVFGKSLAAGFVGGAVAAAFAGLTSNISETVKGIAEIGDEAKRSGMSLQTFQEWKYVAEQNRIGIDSLVDGFKELSLRADEFVTTGQGSASAAFQRLGFSAKDLKKKLEDPSELMLEIIKRLQKFDRAAQIRIADELFGGTGGEKFVQLLSQGEGELRKTIAKAHEAGAVLDKELVDKAAEIDQRFQALSARVSAFGKKLAVTLADIPFDALNTTIDELFKNDGQARSIIGNEALQGLKEAGALTDDQVKNVEQLRNGYLRLEEGARASSMALASAAGMADQLGNDALWEVLAGASRDMRELADQFSRGEISGGDFAKKLGVIQGNASDALAELQGIDKQGFSGVISNLGALGKAIIALIPRARELQKALPGGTPGMDTGTPLTVADIQLPGTDLAPTSSPRPKSTPFLGDVVTPENFNPSKGGKGGGGSSRDQLKAMIDQITQETVALNAQAQALIEVTGSSRDYGDAQEYAQTKAKLLAAAQAEGKEITPELAAQIDGLALSYSKAGKAADDAADRLDKVHERSQQVADAMTSVFSAALEGADSARQAVASLLKELAKAMMHKAFTSLVGGLFGGGSPMMPLGGYTLANVAGARAAGGSVTGGRTYLVGEKGPELWTAPRSGTIIPNHKIGAGGNKPQPVNINVTVSGARGNAEIRQMVTEGVGAGLSHFSSYVLPVRVSQISQNPDIVGA